MVTSYGSRRSEAIAVERSHVVGDEDAGVVGARELLEPAQRANSRRRVEVEARRDQPIEALVGIGGVEGEQERLARRRLDSSE